MKRALFTEITAYFFIILFLYSGISKLMDYTLFKEQIASSPILVPVAPLIAWLLPMTEVIVSILLFIPSWRSKGLKASFGLMTIFTVYILAILTLDDHLPCSCGGIIELMTWKQHLVFNILCTSFSLWGIVLSKQSQRMKKETSTPSYHSLEQ
ncbi:MAG TPA: MauE/DoxX family redox-associated membrane protein [Puia sp.]|nr:MauE/DoxX family redox-associated membrane protein [Puia sp.]